MLSRRQMITSSAATAAILFSTKKFAHAVENKLCVAQILEAGGPEAQPLRIALGDTSLVYAGTDLDGTSYNVNDWHVPAGAAALIRQPDGTVRTGTIINGNINVGPSGVYMRPQTAQSYTVPYEVSGQVFIHSRMNDPIILGSGLRPHWNWAFNIAPVFINEDNNIISGFSPLSENWSSSGQVDKRYGIARDFRDTPPFNPNQYGKWHEWRVVVPEPGTHEIWWDGIRVYRVEERPPFAKWWSTNTQFKVALRFDFYDVSMRIT